MVIEEDPDAGTPPVRDFEGLVSRIEELTPTIKGIWITLDDLTGMRFQACEGISLELSGGIGSGAVSVASRPFTAGEVEFHIHIVPGGRGTAYVP